MLLSRPKFFAIFFLFLAENNFLSYFSLLDLSSTISISQRKISSYLILCYYLSMNFEEKMLDSKIVYDGKVMTVIRDDVEVSDGHKSFREVVLHSGGVVIAAMKDDETILLVKQYRYPLKHVNIELPAGKLEKGENPDFAAKRELEEETGYQAKTWKSLGYINTTPGICTEKLYLYLAKDLKFVGDHPDVGEILKCSEYKLKDVMQMINAGKINDAKTICTLFRAFMKV